MADERKIGRLSSQGGKNPTESKSKLIGERIDVYGAMSAPRASTSRTTQSGTIMPLPALRLAYKLRNARSQHSTYDVRCEFMR